MKIPHFGKNRIVLIIVVLLISLGLVGVALAAAGQTGRAITDAATPPQAQAGGQPDQVLPPSPMQTSYVPPVVQSPPDPLMEQMRQQAMAGSQVSIFGAQTESRSFLTDGQVGQTASSMSSIGVNGTYLPDGIVVDTYLNYIYGKLPVTGTVIINRPDGAYGAAETDGVGFFWTYLYSEIDGGPLAILPGDQLEININGDITTLTVGDQPSGNLNVTSDTVSGNIPNDTGGTVVSATLGMYGQPSTAYETITGVTEPDGSFTITFAPDVDLGPENFTFIDYQVSTGIYQRTSFFPQNVFLIQQHGMISGYAPQKSNVHATVFVGDSGEIRWEGDAFADYPFGWFTFSGVTLDIGDKVVVDFPGGSTEMHYVYSSYFTFSGDDTVSGNVSLPDVAVRLSFVAWDGASYMYYETDANTDVGGNFTAVFPEGGIRPDTRVDVAIMDPSGAGSYMITGQPYLEAIINYSTGLFCAWGRVDKPNASMTLELERDGVIYPRDPSRPITSDPGNLAPGGVYYDGCYALWYDVNNDGNLEAMNFEIGDILRLYTDTWSGEVIVRELHYGADANANFIDGSVFTPSLTTGEIAFRLSQSYISYFPLDVGVEARAQVIDDNFYIPYNDTFDVRARVSMNSFLYDENGFAQQFTEANHFFRVSNDTSVSGRTYIPNEAITLTLWMSGVPIYTSSDQDPDPYSFYFDLKEHRLQPGTMIEVSYQYSGDGDCCMVYEPLSVEGNIETSVVTATGHEGMIDVFGGNDQNGFDQMIPTKASQAALKTTNNGYNLGWGDFLVMAYPDFSGNTHHASNILGEIQRVEFWINPNNYVSIWGTAQPSSEVVIKTSRGDTLSGFAEALDGNFKIDNSTLLLPGDKITVTAGAGLYPAFITIPDIWANSDSANETVSGHTGVFKETEVEIYPWWTGEMYTVTTSVDGEFSKLLPDIPPQGRGHIRFIINPGPPTFVDAIFHRPFYDIVPTMRVNYAHDWVESNYEAGYPVAITVTNDAGEVRATAHGTTGEIPWWGGDTGFSTGYNVLWDGVQPDIQVLDHVYLSLNGYTTDVKLGKISGEINIGADIFTGTLNVPWLTDPVNGDCGVWIENGPGMGFGPVDPNGGIFTCDFTTLGWDLLPGMDVGVGYNDPNGNKVYNVFREPAPDLRINVWGQGQPASGNNYVLEVRYNNDGWATATGVTIAQEFSGMNYLSDTSGFPHTGTGNPGDPIIWQVGDLPYNHNGESQFFVFVQVVSDPGEQVSTNADIDTDMPYWQNDEGRKHTSWESDVSDTSDSDLNLGKWAWTGDPVPGQEFVYAVNVCNNSGNSSSDVYITDTLSISTTLLNWWGQYPGWVEVSASDHQLVVTRPTAPGGWCGEVYINVLLSEQAKLGEPIINEAWTWAESDPNLENNYASTEVKANNPRYNLHLNPNWVQGQFVPGGEIGFEFSVSNWGNMPMPGTVLTTKLPLGTEFLYAYSFDWNGRTPLPPTVIGDGYLMWDIGNFPNGYNQNVGIQLKINSDSPVGTPLVVENSVMGEAQEERYDDNALTFTEVVNDAGPNLRVDKHTNWRWNGDGSLWYELRILNVGTQYLENVVITDTYPISTTMGKCWWNHGPGNLQECTWDDNTHQAVFKLDYMNPGETASANLYVDVLPEYVGLQGMQFVNQAEISDFGDVALADNFDEVTSYTGPDVFVRKWLKAGELRAGEVITYTVEFGNMNRNRWNGDQNYGSHITDTLPSGMTFIKAIGYWDPANTYDPESINGQQLVWGWGTMWAEQTWTFDLVVQIDYGVLPGTELVNVIEAWGDSPNDIEVNPANNYFEYSVSTILYNYLLPIAQRSP